MASIYIDSSILLTLPTSLESATLQSLRAAADQLGLKLHTVRLCVEECLQVRLEQLPDILKKATKVSDELRLVMRQAPSAPDAAMIAGELEALLLEGLQKNGIAVVDTLAPDIQELLQSAVKHIRPFEQGDRGFKDAVIFHSILQHAKGKGVKSFFLLSKDDIFGHPALKQKAEREGLRFQVWSSIGIGINELLEALKNINQLVLLQRAEQLRTFLLSQRDQIRSRVMEDGEINPWSYGFSKILGTKEVDVEDIADTIPGSLPDGQQEGRIPVQFLVRVRAVAAGEPLPPPPSVPTVRLTEGVQQSDILEHVFSGPYPWPAPDYTEQEIHPRFVVQGTVHYDHRTGAYSDLQIERVTTPSEVILRMRDQIAGDESDSGGLR